MDRLCNDCGNSFPDTGDDQCPHCGSTDTFVPDYDVDFEEGGEERPQTREEILEDLRIIFGKFMEEDYKCPGNWRYCEHGKAMIGNAIIGAIKQYDSDFRIEDYL